MWSSVNEKITDGTSGLSPNAAPIALVIGTSTKGSDVPMACGKKSDVKSLFGQGELVRRVTSMQNTMGDVSILAQRVMETQSGTISDVQTTGDINVNIAGIPCTESSVKITVIETKEITVSKSKSSEASNRDNTIVRIAFFDKEIDKKLSDNHIIELEEFGLTITFPEGIYTKESSWIFTTTAPKVSFEVLEQVIQQTLEVHTPEFVYIAQSVDAEFVNKLGALSEKLFEDHKAVLFLTETGLNNSLSLDEAIANKKSEFAKIDARFVSVVCESNSESYIKMSGLAAGHITKASVNQSIGATNYFAIYDYKLPSKWTNVHSRSLDESRFITLRTYAGLNNLFWANGRTLAGDTSDYRYIEVVRTVFKAIRLARRVSLPYIHANGDEVGLQNLVTEVRSAVETMTNTTPKELDDFNVELPEGQDIVNNGVILNIELFGIPIIRKILLNFAFKYQNNK